VPRNKVGVIVANGIDDVAGEAQPADRTNPMNKSKRVLAFILISSFGYYISRQKEKRQRQIEPLALNILRGAVWHPSY
jgi:hypothetical protein